MTPVSLPLLPGEVGGGGGLKGRGPSTHENGKCLRHQISFCGYGFNVFYSFNNVGFFRLSFHNCLSCVITARIFLLFDLSSAVQNICFIYLHLFIHPSRVYYELTTDMTSSQLA